MAKPAIVGGRPVRKQFLPPFRHMIGREEIDEVVETLKSDWLTTGPRTHKFEEMFKEYIGCEHALAVSSCTAAMHLALVADNIGKGDEVLTSPFTFAATANVIIHQNAKPIFVDIDERTYNIDPAKIEEKITDKSKAIMPVHYAGHPCEMDEILRIAKKHGMIVIEDAAHALGAIYKKRKVGTIGDVTCFSFYATKNLTTGEGGMITTDDNELAEKTEILRLHGMSKDAWKRYSSKGSWYYEILCPGYKYNMTDLQSAMGIHQLEKLPKMQKRRDEITRRYNEAFSDMPEIVTPTARKCVKHAWHLYSVQINSNTLKIDRAKFVEALRAENVGTSVHFIPLHLHPYYRDRYKFKRGDFPNAEHVYDREVSLPVYPRMTDRDVEDVIAAVKKIVEYFRA